MSAYVDAQRREDALHARIEDSKAVRRHLDVIVCMELEGISECETARRLGVGRKKVSLYRWVLGLTTRIPEAVLRDYLRGAKRREGRVEVRRPAAQE